VGHGQELYENPLLEESLGTSGNRSKLDTCLPTGISPRHDSVSRDPQSGAEELEPQRYLLPRCQGRNGLNADAVLTQVTDNPTISLVHIHVRETMEFLPISPLWDRILRRGTGGRRDIQYGRGVFH